MNTIIKLLFDVIEVIIPAFVTTGVLMFAFFAYRLFEVREYYLACVILVLMTTMSVFAVVSFVRLFRKLTS